MIIINTPHNPVGKVFNREELEKIAEISKEYNLLVMSDEVVSPLISVLLASMLSLSIQYECLVHDGLDHIPIATLPGMWERTVSVYSAGSKSRLSQYSIDLQIMFILFHFSFF